jgi:hypothetical protein
MSFASDEVAGVVCDSRDPSVEEREPAGFIRRPASEEGGGRVGKPILPSEPQALAPGAVYLIN